MKKSIVREAVATLCEEIKTALQGENTANDIKNAVYTMNNKFKTPSLEK